MRNSIFIIIWVCLQHNASSKSVHITKTIVYPGIIEERSEQGTYILLVNEHITLNVRKATPVAKNLKILYEDIDNKSLKDLTLRNMTGEVYEDAKDHTAVMISFNNGLRVKGIIRRKFIIDHLEAAGPKMGLVPHMLTTITSHEIPNSDMQKAGTFRNSRRLFQERQIVENEGSGHQSGPTSVTVKAGIIVSQQYIQEFKTSNYSDITEVSDYLSVFFCFVNMFLKKFRHDILDLEIRVYRIFLLQETTYSFIQYANEEKDVIAGCSLKTLNDFVNSRSEQFFSTDVVFYFSPYPISTPNANGVTTVHASGYTTVGGACTGSRSILLQDKPRTYGGVLTAAHELLHSLGSVHDGAPGAETCSSEEPYIMAPDMVANRELQISTCTEDQVLAFTRSNRGSCLRAKIHRHKRKIAPSEIKAALLNTETFCRRVVPTGTEITFSPGVQPDDLKSCFLSCKWTNRTHQHHELHSAPDYTPCEFDATKVTKVCIHGTCSPIPSVFVTFPKYITSKM